MGSGKEAMVQEEGESYGWLGNKSTRGKEIKGKEERKEEREEEKEREGKKKRKRRWEGVSAIRQKRRRVAARCRG